MRSTSSVLLVVITLAIMTPTFANENAEKDHRNTEQEIGLGTGTIIGGVIAGPPGMIAGAFIGNLFGKNIADEKQNSDLQKTNVELEKKLLASEKTLHEINDEFSRENLVLRDTHLTIERLLKKNQELKNHALNFNIQFRTNSTEIEKQYQKYLADLAIALNTTPTMEVEVAGYADRMGDEDYNMELSIERARHVKDYLVSQGIEEKRITTLAHGESQPLHVKENLENNFFDRRVSVYLRPIELSTQNIADEIAANEANQAVATK